jgi:hypothetical protein
MRRSKLVLAALVVMVAVMVVAAVPVMADSLREERRESPRTQLREENNHNFNNCCVNRGLNGFGFSGLNNCGWSWIWIWNCNNWWIF